MARAIIRRITIWDGVRRGRVSDPVSGEPRTHGLGLVGEPILGYLGLRAEGYEIDLPERKTGVEVVEVDFDGVADVRGCYPLISRAWADLEVPDFAFEGESGTPSAVGGRR